MKAIWRFSVNIRDISMVTMPKGAEILSVGLKDAASPILPNPVSPLGISIWALVEVGASTVQREIRVSGTGHSVQDDVSKNNYIGTVILENGALVFHFFDMGEKGG